MKIGKTELNGLDRRMEYPPLEDLGSLDAIVTPAQIKGLLLGAFSGGGGILLTGAIARALIKPKEGDAPLSPEDATKQTVYRSLLSLALGLVGGRLLWDLDEDAAKGFVGGVGGFGVASLVSEWSVKKDGGERTIPVSLSAYDPGYRWGMGAHTGRRHYQRAGKGVMGMGAGYDPGYRWGQGGVGRTRVTGQPVNTPTLGRTRVVSKNYMAPSLAGLSQDVTVGRWIS